MTFLFLGLNMSLFFSFCFFAGVSKFDVEKCPSMFFILCGHLAHVYIYLNICSNIFTNILMGFNFDLKLGVGVKIFKITIGR